MNAVPAKVAGVKEVVICSPAGRDGMVNPVVLAASHLAGVRTVFRLGGAQAIAAMAYGTESVPKVDVISGPGNLYVTLAKQAVYGQVGIDSRQQHGPRRRTIGSRVIVGKANPRRGQC